MNIAFYVPNLGDQKLVNEIVTEVQINKENIDSATIFFDNIGPFPFGTSISLFNSTEIWSFVGKLLLFTDSCWLKTKSIINKFNTYFYYDSGNMKNTLVLLDMVNDNCKVIAKNKDDADKFYRLTGKEVAGICEDLVDVTKVMSNE